MDMLERHKLYEKAWELWGEGPQLDMINEECAELIKAVCKFKRNKVERSILLQNIIEEMVDVVVMCGQFIQVFKQHDEFDRIFNEKLFKLDDKVVDFENERDNHVEKAN